ncbi:MAG: alpha/beta hydrolase [Acidimicrobiales bacterium]
MAYDLAGPAEPRAGAVLLHPHPDFGGDRHNLVVDALYRALPAEGVTAVRFDFPSADPELARRATVGALDPLAAHVSAGAPLFLAGYSYGADIALTVTDERLAGWFLVAPPLAFLPARRLTARAEPRPKAVVVPEHDQFSVPGRTTEATQAWLNTTLTTIPGGDHFLVGHTALVVEECLRFVATLRVLCRKYEPERMDG